MNSNSILTQLVSWQVTLSLSMEDAVSQARNAGALLENMLILIEPSKLDENEIVKVRWQWKWQG